MSRVLALTSICRDPGRAGVTSLLLGGVTTIPTECFRDLDSLVTVTFAGTSVTSIGNSAFRYCNVLSSIVHWGNVVTINSASFNNCPALTHLDFTTATFIYITDSAFRDMSSLQTINWGTVVQTIGVRTFSNCDSLTSLSWVGSAVTKIRESGFRDSGALGSGASVITWGTVTTIEANAFMNTGITTLDFTAALFTTFGTGVFQDCSSLLTITWGVLIDIPDSGFSNCPSLHSTTPLVFTGTSIATIGDWAFYNCIGIQTIDFTAISPALSYRSFYHCTGTTPVTL